MKNKNPDNSNSPSFHFIEQIIARLENRHLLKELAESTSKHFFSENEFQSEYEVDVKCTGNKPIVFVCNTAYDQACPPPVKFVPCGGMSGNASYTWEVLKTPIDLLILF